MSNFPKLCRNCIYSTIRDNDWDLRCTNPVVNSNDPWALSSKEPLAGTSCRGEREVRWFAKCGMKGKLYEERLGLAIRPNVGGLLNTATGVGCEGS